MSLERPLVVRALMGAAAIMLAVGLIGAFTVDSGGDNNADLAARDATTTTTAGDVTTTTIDETPAIGGADATSTTVAGKAVTTTIASANVPDPGPSKPPAPGVYDYKFVYATDPSRNADITEKVEAQPDQAGVHYRKETYPDGQGNSATNDVAYATDGVRITASHIVAAKSTVDCTWTPPILFLALPLALDKTWTHDSKCTATVGGAQATVEKKGDSKVIGKALDIVGSTSVRTWIIEIHDVFTVNHPFFSTSRDAVITRHWSPDYGLVTFEKEVGKTNGQDYTTERTLENIKPR